MTEWRAVFQTANHRCLLYMFSSESLCSNNYIICIFIDRNGFKRATNSMQNPMCVKIFESEKGLQHVRFDVRKSKNNAGVFDDNLHKINDDRKMLINVTT